MEASRTQQREKISKVIREADAGLVTVEGASSSLGVSRSDAARALSRWAEQGWFSRIRRGIYAPISISASTPVAVLDDPWVLVPTVFGESYIGGWTAAEHWHLTEQIFRTIVVFTTMEVRHSELSLGSTPFKLHHVPNSRFYGLKAVWHGTLKVQVSDPHKTIIDILENPELGGGIDHVFFCLRTYIASDQFDGSALIAYLRRANNGSINKRLGFLIDEFIPSATPLVLEVRAGLTQGNIKLDPKRKSPRLVKKWRLWVPRDWAPQ